MDIASTLTYMPLAVVCPHCGHSDEDDYELITDGCVHDMRCGDGCGARFQMAVMECKRCAEESVFSWKSAPSTELLARLACLNCGQAYMDDQTKPEADEPLRY